MTKNKVYVNGSYIEVHDNDKVDVTTNGKTTNIHIEEPRKEEGRKMKVKELIGILETLDPESKVAEIPITINFESHRVKDVFLYDDHHYYYININIKEDEK